MELRPEGWGSCHGKSIPGRGSSTCKGPGVGTGMLEELLQRAGKSWEVRGWGQGGEQVGLASEAFGIQQGAWVILQDPEQQGRLEPGGTKAGPVRGTRLTPQGRGMLRMSLFPGGSLPGGPDPAPGQGLWVCVLSSEDGFCQTERTTSTPAHSRGRTPWAL